jgi:hypothetical protein
VDFELLQRTPEHEREVAASRRAEYLVRQRDRFAREGGVKFPTHLQPTNLLGIEYVYGHSESTQGMLWIVGKDYRLFDYFQPERWRRTPRSKVSDTNEVYYTRTKDNISVVWKVSRVGEPPDVNPLSPTADAALEYGYNSPFEEFAFALELSRKGLPTVYPRAIYMTGLEAKDTDYALDESRYQSHDGLMTPDGRAALQHHHNYITVWGYWNGLDEVLASHDGNYCTGINASHALRTDLITDAEYSSLIKRVTVDLRERGFEDLNPKGSHYLLSLDASGSLICDDDGIPVVRMCNFSLVRRIG